MSKYFVIEDGEVGNVHMVGIVARTPESEEAVEEYRGMLALRKARVRQLKQEAEEKVGNKDPRFSPLGQHRLTVSRNDRVLLTTAVLAFKEGLEPPPSMIEFFESKGIEVDQFHEDDQLWNSPYYGFEVLYEKDKIIEQAKLLKSMIDVGVVEDPIK